MEKEKQRKILKICGIVAFAVVMIVIVVLCIVSADYKRRTQQLQDDNQQMEDILQNPSPDQTPQEGKNSSSIVLIYN